VLDTGFVAAVLEGIEATLGELIERVATSELQSSLDVLQSRVTALRGDTYFWEHLGMLDVPSYLTLIGAVFFNKRL